MADPRYCLVATAKNEGPYLLEWVAWHRMIGFTDLIVFQNDSDDLTHFILREMDRLGLVNYRYNKAPPGRQQVRAYIRAAQEPVYQQADWVMALDLDEFLTFNSGIETIPEWLGLLPEADRILVNWKLFGSSGLIMPPDGLVSESFTMADHSERIARFREPFKTFFRRDAFWRPGIHKPVGHPDAAEDAPEPRTVNASGLTEDEFLLVNYQSKDPEMRRYAQVNHYIVRDAGSFLLKSTRGSAHQDQRKIEDEYWTGRNRNHEEDTSFAACAPAIRERMEMYDEMSGGKLLRLRDEALMRHRTRIMALMARSDCRDLYYRCANIDADGEIEAQNQDLVAAE